MYLKFQFPSTLREEIERHNSEYTRITSQHDPVNIYGTFCPTAQQNTTKILLRASSRFTKIDHILLIKPFLTNTILNHGNLLFDINRKK